MDDFLREWPLTRSRDPAVRETAFRTYVSDPDINREETEARYLKNLRVSARGGNMVAFVVDKEKAMAEAKHHFFLFTGTEMEEKKVKQEDVVKMEKKEPPLTVSRRRLRWSCVHPGPGQTVN